jgi:hypothetical protein
VLSNSLIIPAIWDNTTNISTQTTLQKEIISRSVVTLLSQVNTKIYYGLRISLLVSSGGVYQEGVVNKDLVFTAGADPKVLVDLIMLSLTNPEKLLVNRQGGGSESVLHSKDGSKVLLVNLNFRILEEGLETLPAVASFLHKADSSKGRFKKGTPVLRLMLDLADDPRVGHLTRLLPGGDFSKADITDLKLPESPIRGMGTSSNCIERLLGSNPTFGHGHVFYHLPVATKGDNIFVLGLSRPTLGSSQGDVLFLDQICPKGVTRFLVARNDGRSELRCLLLAYYNKGEAVFRLAIKAGVDTRVELIHAFDIMTPAHRTTKLPVHYGVFDFETYQEGEYHRPYAAGFKITGMDPVTVYINGKDHAGVTLNLFKSIFKTYMTIPKSKRAQTLTLYAHNLSKFDGHLVLLTLANAGYEVTPTFKDAKTILEIQVRHKS